ncbi:MAG: M23 family metallopeptidase [Cyanobacteriota bacterium]|jgi:murein DD-endopeptidase MepM/ murein hydrolase activator NlpD
MPSACSDPATPGQRRPRSRRGILLGLLLLCGQATPGTPAHASQNQGWLRGAFPVSRFGGYTSPFGMRSHPLSGDLRPHYGLDIASPLGAPVRSWWSGRVSEVIRDGGCGNGLVIRSGDYEHIYCHLQGTVEGNTYRSAGVQLRTGQRVRTGEVIAHVGLTGSTTGPHLHWGLRYRGNWLDPARVLRAMAESRRQRTPARQWAPNVGQLR